MDILLFHIYFPTYKGFVGVAAACEPRTMDIVQVQDIVRVQIEQRKRQFNTANLVWTDAQYWKELVEDVKANEWKTSLKWNSK